MKVQKILELLTDALDHGKFTNAAFDDMGSARPVTMRDGSPVTEANVNEFIRQRTDLYMRSWVLSPIAEAINLIKASLPHEFIPLFKDDLDSQYCAFCHKGKYINLHQGKK
jgi:hypothetical protein